MTYLNGLLKNRYLLVTGATGFIGSRLAFRLASEEGAVVTGVGRKLDRFPLLADAGVELRQVDLTAVEQMKALVQGQEVVIHSAWLGREAGPVGGAHLRNVAILADLMHMAADAGVKRFVFLSSISAYGPPRRERVDETHAVSIDQRDEYGRSKALAELKAAEISAQTGMELVIIRPAMVYGPQSRTWTLRMIELIKKGFPLLFGDGSGHAYPLFIDNLVDGLMLAAVRPEAAGRAFNFSDDALDWRTFFGYYAGMVNRRARSIPLWMASLLAFATEKFRLGLPLTREWLAFYLQRNSFPIEKAQSLLGYQPRLTVDDGMALTEKWLRESGYLDD